MNISVCMPIYNCERTLAASLDSVLCQSVRPIEILVMDDGSTDGTPEILERYRKHITLLKQPNQGVSAALNVLFAKATGDIIARLDGDDLWHPRYLEVQQSACEAHPGAVAYFTGHVDFWDGPTYYDWNTQGPQSFQVSTLVMDSVAFLRRYNSAPGAFACMSHCCVRRATVELLGNKPFELRMAEDLYFLNRLALLGSVVYNPVPLAAYRIRRGSLSSDRLVLNRAEVAAMELLENHYKAGCDPTLLDVFQESIGMKRRQLAKILLGSKMTAEARRELRRGIGSAGGFTSFCKSFALLAISFLPRALQPAWPLRYRAAGEPLTGGVEKRPVESAYVAASLENLNSQRSQG